MEDYYSVLILLSVIAVSVVQLCVSKSSTLSTSRKKVFHLLFSTIAVAAVCEWLGICLQGTGESTRTLHIIVKAVELSIAPAIALFVAWIIERRRARVLYALLLVHAAIECLSGVFGFIYYVDSESNYVHAAFYWVYVAAYLMTIVYCIYIVLRNVRKYQYSGISYFLATVGLMLLGIVIQLLQSQLRVVYFTLALASMMLYVFTLEMIHQTDELTELVNRRGFENCIAHIEERCVIIFFDVDRFKRVNDSYGHAFGDMALSTIGKAIRGQYAKYGKCFRYGGDEFCVILNRGLDTVEELNGRFLRTMEQLMKKEPRLPGVSIGYAYFDPESSNVEDTVAEADQMMYQQKQSRRKENTQTE